MAVADLCLLPIAYLLAAIYHISLTGSVSKRRCPELFSETKNLGESLQIPGKKFNRYAYQIRVIITNHSRTVRDRTVREKYKLGGQGGCPPFRVAGYRV